MEVVVKPRALGKALKVCWSANRVPCIWGSPGIGKSDIVRQTAFDWIAEALGIQGDEGQLVVLNRDFDKYFRDIRAVLFDPVDLRGLPHVNGDGRAHWAIPDWLPKDGIGILFIDELNRAPTLVMNAFLQLILDRRLGDYVLPEGWLLVVACNPEKFGGGVNKMPQALGNRMQHLSLDVDINDWSHWALKADIEPIVIAFLRFRHDLLNVFSKDNKDDLAFPTPRSWHMVSDTVKQVALQNVPQELALALYAGTVGEGAAIEYMAYERLYKSLPNIDAILLNPQTEPVPPETATLFAVTSALASRADPNNIGRIVQYINRCPVEYRVFTMKEAAFRNPAIQATNDFLKWAIADSEVAG